MRNTTVAMGLLAMLAVPGAARAAQPVCGDVNDSGSVTVADALTVLRKAVGQAPSVNCGPPSLLPKTGQTTCYDVAGAAVACASTGQDGQLQRGIARSFTDNGDGTITDNTTSLVWEKLSADGGIHEYTTYYAWADAFATKVTALNAAKFAGHDDWRVPNIVELESLRNFGATDPSVYSVFDSGCTSGCTTATCSCTWSGYYWSSSTALSATDFAWHVSFVRAVRGGRV